MTSLKVDNHEVRGGAPMPGQRIVTYSYTPDKLNRSGMSDTATGQTASYTFSPLNQYTSVGMIGYSYDYNFNLTGGEGFNGTYDAANRLVSASNSGMAASPEVELVYDGLGRCVKRTIQGVATIIIYDDWKPIAEWDGFEGGRGVDGAREFEGHDDGSARQAASRVKRPNDLNCTHK